MRIQWLIAVTLLQTACAPAVRSAPPLEPGTYSFRGSVTETHQYGTGVRQVTVPVSGTIQLDEAQYFIASSHGGCSGQFGDGHALRWGVTASCPTVSVSLGARGVRSASVRVLVNEVRETRGSCAEWQVVNGTNQCVRYEWNYREHSSWRTAQSISFIRDAR